MSSVRADSEVRALFRRVDAERGHLEYGFTDVDGTQPRSLRAQFEEVP